MVKIGIIGYGEIGTSIHKIYSSQNFQVSIVDPFKNYNDNIDDCYILNVCIPYSEYFVDYINNYVTNHKPNITVIHSTVCPGTTQRIKGDVVHSPVRGIHPYLYDGLKTFLKFIGSEDKKIAEEYKMHLESLNIKSYICANSKTTEYAKLLDTTYYGLCIAFHNEVSKLCETEEIPFSEVMTLYNNSYNEGYMDLKKPNVIRPVLYSGGNKIGGHCIIPNAEILSKYLSSPLIDGILKYK